MGDHRVQTAPNTLRLRIRLSTMLTQEASDKENFRILIVRSPLQATCWSMR